MKRILFYIPYPLDDQRSGSRVRPVRMRDGFRAQEYKVDTVSGAAEARKLPPAAKLAKTYSFCYMESGSYPMNPLVDYPNLVKIAASRLPLGIYIRDAYWMFPEYLRLSGAKGFQLAVRYRLDSLVLRSLASVLFFPTAPFAQLFRARCSKELLPPGGKITDLHAKKLGAGPARILYVGEVSPVSGVGALLEATAILNEEIPVRLDLVCRREEISQIRTPSRLEAPWVRIHHLAADEMPMLLRQATIGVVPRPMTPYNNIAFPIKLMDYLSAGLPVVVTHCAEVMNFVTENQCGIVCDESTTSLASGLKAILENPQQYETMSENAIRAILTGNQWKDRAAFVAAALRPGSY